MTSIRGPGYYNGTAATASLTALEAPLRGAATHTPAPVRCPAQLAAGPGLNPAGKPAPPGPAWLLPGRRLSAAGQ